MSKEKAAYLITYTTPYHKPTGNIYINLIAKECKAKKLFYSETIHGLVARLISLPNVWLLAKLKGSSVTNLIYNELQ